MLFLRFGVNTQEKKRKEKRKEKGVKEKRFDNFWNLSGAESQLKMFRVRASQNSSDFFFFAKIYSNKKESLVQYNFFSRNPKTQNMTEIDPSQTLYITNLNGRITVEGKSSDSIRVFISLLTLQVVFTELKSSLYGLFSTYGPILDITAKKTYKMREQAFVVYDNVASATTAKRGLNGFTFFDRPIVSVFQLIKLQLEQERSRRS